MSTEIISIDGPSGSGKTSVGKLLASDLNCKFISSGLIYRTITKGIIDLLNTNTFFQGLYSFSEIYDAFVSNQFIVKILQLRDTGVLIEYKDVENKRTHEHLSSSKDLYTAEITELTTNLSKIVVIRYCLSWMMLSPICEVRVRRN